MNREIRCTGTGPAGDDPAADAGLERFKRAVLRMLTVALLFKALPAHAAVNALESISFATLPGERIQLSLLFTQAPPRPLAFTVNDPARIALDFPDVVNRVRERAKAINVGLTRSVYAVQAKDRTRVVVALARSVAYQSEIVGNQLILTLGNGDAPAIAGASKIPSAARDTKAEVSAPQAPRITDIDFRRGETGEGRILVGLSDPDVPVDLREQDGKILVAFGGADLSQALQQRLDVIDFATPVSTIDAFTTGDDVQLVIDATGKYEHLAYQAENLYTIEVHPAIEDEEGERKKEQFTGERLSLNFQDIEVRSVLQLIADFTGLNIVVSDSVIGNLTLRLKNVPWDQALNIVLKTKGLDMRRADNVLLVAPAEEIAAREKLELEAQQQSRELAPLRSEFVQVNYARAGDLATLLKAPENSLLSERGKVSVDVRTNTLLVQDTAVKLDEIRRLVERLDVPVRQVLIESRIVIASDNFSKELGVRFGTSHLDDDGSVRDAFSGSLNGTSQLFRGDELEFNDRLNVNLPVANPAGSIGMALAKLPFDLLLELELSAAQAESRAEIVSTPKVITANQHPARIEQGVEIPYQTTTENQIKTEFKKAVLSLQVTPQITPDDRIIMDLLVNNDSVGQVVPSGVGQVPTIDTRAVETQVLVDNGQTVVLGGIYEQSLNKSSSRVPFFSDIPLLGRLFRNDFSNSDKAELLIFVTPKIISDNLALAR